MFLQNAEFIDDAAQSQSSDTTNDASLLDITVVNVSFSSTMNVLPANISFDLLLFFSGTAQSRSNSTPKIHLAVPVPILADTFLPSTTFDTRLAFLSLNRGRNSKTVNSTHTRDSFLPSLTRVEVLPNVRGEIVWCHCVSGNPLIVMLDH